MATMKELERKRINESAGHYLSDQDEGDNYDAYLKLLEESDNGNDNCAAADYVNVWQPLEHFTVAKMIEVIENSAKGTDIEDQPEFIQKIDWELLKKQKKSLLAAIEHAESTGNNEYCDDLNGILNLIDSLQDYAVDEIGLDENSVFDLHPEE